MAKLGNVRKFYLTTGKTGGTFTWLKGEQNNSFNRSAESIEVSDKSNDWAQFISGKKGANASVTVFTDDTSTEPQHKMISSLHNGQPVYGFIGELSGDGATTPTEGDLFEAIITGISDTNDYGAVASRSLDLTITGAPTHYPTITEG